MFVVYTTEENLIRLCSEKENSWYKIIMKIKEVVIKTISPDEVWDSTNSLLQNLHKAGVKIDVENKFFENISNSHPEMVLEDPCAAYLVDINKQKATEIQNKYGVICQPCDNNADNVLVAKGWNIDTADPDKPKSWDFFYSNHKCPINSIVIVDRYFFSSEVGETIKDSFENLRQLLDALLPAECSNNMPQVALIFDFSTFKHDRDKKSDGTNYTFKTLAERVNKVKRNVRNYSYEFELISMDSNCYLYEETHDRRVISNYNITNATHKLKAFRSPNTSPNTSLCNQNITFQRLFEQGLDDKSSTPESSQRRVLNALSKAIETSKTSIEYAYNGQVSDKGTFQIKNRMLRKKERKI